MWYNGKKKRPGCIRSPGIYLTTFYENGLRLNRVALSKKSDSAEYPSQTAYVLDDVVVGENGAEITGVVKCCVLYIATGDDPMSSVEVEIPFSYTADTVPLAQEDSVRIHPCIDQLTASLLNSEEIEIKAQINLNISVFAKGESQAMTDLQILPIDEAKKAAQPGIVGYVVQKGDSMWSIAKKYYASIDAIKQLNNLESDYVSEGDRLLIVKS